MSVAILAAFTAACSGAAQDRAPFRTGTFVSVANEDVEYRWESDGTWSYHAFGIQGAEGRYTVKGFLWTENATAECPSTATSEWSFDGSRLSFTPVRADACDPRREATDGQSFILQE